jgi:hypothetical protein
MTITADQIIPGAKFTTEHDIFVVVSVDGGRCVNRAFDRPRSQQDDSIEAFVKYLNEFKARPYEPDTDWDKTVEGQDAEWVSPMPQDPPKTEVPKKEYQVHWMRHYECFTEVFAESQEEAERMVKIGKVKETDVRQHRPEMGIHEDEFSAQLTGESAKAECRKLVNGELLNAIGRQLDEMIEQLSEASEWSIRHEDIVEYVKERIGQTVG